MPFNQTLYTVPLPGSGALLVYILNMLRIKLDHSEPESLLNLQRTVETFKFAYGSRTLLGDTRTPEMDKVRHHLKGDGHLLSWFFSL